MINLNESLTDINNILKLKESDHIKDYKMQLEFNTVTIILLTMLVIGIILAIGKFDYEKDKNLK